MLVLITIISNIFICFVNLTLLFLLIKIKKKLSDFNSDLPDLEKSLIISLKQIPLNILLTALEIKEYNNKYQAIQFQIQKIRQFMIISRYIYKVYQRKFRFLYSGYDKLNSKMN